jgi:thymidylate kinase
MYLTTIEFTSDVTVYLEVSPKQLLERLYIRKGDHRRAQIKPYVEQTEDHPVELADLLFADGTTTRRVPFEMFSFVD